MSHRIATSYLADFFIVLLSKNMKQDVLLHLYMRGRRCFGRCDECNYCKFRNFREDLIFTDSVKRHICNVQISQLRHDLPILVNDKVISFAPVFSFIYC